MMTVFEYASDINKEVTEVLNKCKILGINATSKDDTLDQISIVELDNTFENEEKSDKIDEEIEDEISLEEEAKSILKVDVSIKKEKIVNKKTNKFSKKPKEKLDEEKKKMYKNKKKLKSQDDVNSDTIYIKEDCTVLELAEAIEVSSSVLITKIIGLGQMLSLNNVISFELAELIGLEFGKIIKPFEKGDISDFDNFEVEYNEETLTKRPPVVTIMGHVDHGKTTLLDTLRQTNVTDKEAGGITQHIGAYQIEYNDEKITFIDTPGHAAFTKMRARGAKITDIIIIIVAADDGVMEQTREAIDHAKAANVPILVAINKIDKPNINIDKVLTDLSSCNLTPESWGGDTIVTNISALNKIGLDELLDNILLVSQMNEYKANKDSYAIGTVIEAHKDKGTGVNATMLVQNGMLRIGDPIVVGTSYGKIRLMKNDKNEEILKALPGDPVTIIGLDNIPNAGDRFIAFENEKKAKIVRDKRITNESLPQQKKSVNLEDVFARMGEDFKELNIILKADVKGSEEALISSLKKLDIGGIKINLIRTGVGGITDSDIILASSTDSIIIGFNIRPNKTIMDNALKQDVDIRLHNIIYKVIEEMELALSGMLNPEFEEKVTGTAEIRQIFKFSKIGLIAGCMVTDGVIKRDSSARIIRNSVIVYDSSIATIQREKNQAKEVKAGFECGITIEKFNDIREGDVIETYEVVKKGI
ncbi:MAG: translation initiation factor IF-2 [Bacilli bacterium]